MSAYTSRTGGPRNSNYSRGPSNGLEEMYEHTAGVVQAMDKGGFEVHMTRIKPQYQAIMGRISMSSVDKELGSRLRYVSKLYNDPKFFTLQPYVRNEAWGTIRQAYITLTTMLGRFLNKDKPYGGIGKCYAGSCSGPQNNLFSAKNMYVGRDSYILNDLNEQYSLNQAAMKDKEFNEKALDHLEMFAASDLATTFEYNRERGLATGVDLTDISTHRRTGNVNSLSVPAYTNPDVEIGECQGIRQFPNYGGIGGQSIPNNYSFAAYSGYGNY